MTDDQVTARLAAIAAQLQRLGPPTESEVDAYLRAHPFPDDGFMHTADGDRWVVAGRLWAGRNAQRARLNKEQGQLEHVQLGRALEGFNSPTAKTTHDPPPTAVEIDVQAVLDALPDAPAMPTTAEPAPRTSSAASRTLPLFTGEP